MRQTTTAELRLDHGKRRVLDSRTGTPAVWLRTEAIAIEFRCGAPRRDGQSPPNSPGIWGMSDYTWHSSFGEEQ
jgi:hypothetical protein